MAKPNQPLPPEVLAAFERRQPIEAIKLLLVNRAGLAQTAQQQQRGRKVAAPNPSAPGKMASIHPAKGLSPGQVPNTVSKFWGWAVVALFAYLAYRLVQG